MNHPPRNGPICPSGQASGLVDVVWTGISQSAPIPEARRPADRSNRQSRTLRRRRSAPERRPASRPFEKRLHLDV